MYYSPDPPHYSSFLTFSIAPSFGKFFLILVYIILGYQDVQFFTFLCCFQCCLQLILPHLLHSYNGSPCQIRELLLYRSNWDFWVHLDIIEACQLLLLLSFLLLQDLLLIELLLYLQLGKLLVRICRSLLRPPRDNHLNRLGVLIYFLSSNSLILLGHKRFTYELTKLMQQLF